MSYSPRLSAHVKDGQLILADPVAWRSLLARNNGREVVVSVVRKQSIHTPNQQRYYWGVVVEMIAGHIGESREDTHELLKERFLPKREVELLDGQHLEMPPSTKTLTVERYAEYIRGIKVWAVSFLGLLIPEANEVEVA